MGGAFEGAGVAIGSLVGGAVYKSQVRRNFILLTDFQTLLDV